MLQFSICWLLPALQLGRCWEYPSSTLASLLQEHQESISSGFKYQQNLYCAMCKPPKYKCLTKPYCSLLDFELFPFPLLFGTFPPQSTLTVRWKKLETSIKNGEISYKPGGRWGCTVLLAEHLILYRGSAPGKAQGWVLTCYSKQGSLPPPAQRLRVSHVQSVFPSLGALQAVQQLLPESLTAAQLGWPWHSKRVTVEGPRSKSTQLHPSHQHCLPVKFLELMLLQHLETYLC